MSKRKFKTPKVAWEVKYIKFQTEGLRKTKINTH